MPLIAAVQMMSGADKQRNVQSAIRWVREAAQRGAALVGLPENFSWMGPEAERSQAAESLEGPTLSTLASVARELGIVLVAGSILESGATGGRLHNTCAVFGPDGSRLAVYRKVHLFDVELRDGASYRESAGVAPGTEVVAVDALFARLGLSICYDLRFPELYRMLSARGATLLTVPSAFTLTTGKDHWEVLLRARAIENQAYVLAPAQWGNHSERRMTYGHALIADPWGLVTALCPDGEGLALAPYEPDRVARIRADLPALQHRRF